MLKPQTAKASPLDSRCGSSIAMSRCIEPSSALGNGLFHTKFAPDSSSLSDSCEALPVQEMTVTLSRPAAASRSRSRRIAVDPRMQLSSMSENVFGFGFGLGQRLGQRLELG
jgi:hypothetical protein